MKTQNSLLLADAIINLALGCLLLFFPRGVVSVLGAPPAQVAFYPSILGAVLFGIGVALLIERSRGGGLGLNGAITINLCGSLVLAFWLLFGKLALPLRGYLVLWGLAVLVLGIGIIELRAQKGRRNAN